MKQLLLIAGLVTIYSGLISCSDSEVTQACSMTADSVKVIDQLNIDDHTYFLVHRISGWHEKINSFELYNARPIFDNCGESVIQPLFGASVDDKDSNNNDQHVARIYYEVPNKLILDYQKGPGPGIDHYHYLVLEQKEDQ